MPVDNLPQIVHNKMNDLKIVQNPKQNNRLTLKTLDTIGTCQSPVFSLNSVSQQCIK